MTEQVEELEACLSDDRVISIQQVVSNEGVSVAWAIVLCIAGAVIGGVLTALAILI